MAILTIIVLVGTLLIIILASIGKFTKTEYEFSYLQICEDKIYHPAMKVHSTLNHKDLKRAKKKNEKNFCFLIEIGGLNYDMIVDDVEQLNAEIFQWKVKKRDTEELYSLVTYGFYKRIDLMNVKTKQLIILQK